MARVARIGVGAGKTLEATTLSPETPGLISREALELLGEDDE
jgi:hypothetical protein